MIHRFVPVLFAAFTTAVVATAQVPVTVRCTPTDGSAAGCYYCPGFEHVIKWVGTQMHSSTVNLLQYHNLDVVVQGTWNGSVIEVSSVQPVVESFSIGGNGSIGHRFDFSTVAADGDVALNLAALGNGFTALFDGLALQLSLLTATPLGAGVVQGGEYKSRLDIPNLPSLIGLRVYGQGIVLQQGGGIYSTNVDTKVVS
ncbi:MAG: hypothetical protein JNK15_02395 [Planctomycetes bacterium]|nr:hypothetical protein [Planctomycetota bacterium]